MTVRFTSGRLAAIALLSTTLLLLSGAPIAAAGTKVTGAGSTWSQIAVDQWRADVARMGLDINYQGVGSSAGRQYYMIGQVDFAVSEIPFLPEEVEKLRGAGRSFQYLPIVAGGTSLMYHLRDASGTQITNLQLSAASVAGIFTGGITKWNDPKIVADNGGRPMPDLDIVPVIRSDGSGTSAQFSGYLSKMTAAVWRQFARERGIEPGPTSNYPEFPGSVGQKGSDGVANYVSSSTGVGSITYVEAGYAIERGFPVASLRNASGKFTQPTARNVAIALTRARLNADRTQNLSGVYTHPDPSAYAMSSYSYMITPTSGIDAARGEVLGKFIVYFACEGQQKAEVLGYSPLPENLVKVAFEAVRNIPGAPTPPPLSECANPNIRGEGSTGGIGGPTGPGSGGGDQPSSDASESGGRGQGSDGPESGVRAPGVAGPTGSAGSSGKSDQDESRAVALGGPAAGAGAITGEGAAAAGAGVVLPKGARADLGLGGEAATYTAEDLRDAALTPQQRADSVNLLTSAAERGRSRSWLLTLPVAALLVLLFGPSIGVPALRRRVRLK